jgi:lantibiotic leader peptide-processing serine protease
MLKWRPLLLSVLLLTAGLPASGALVKAEGSGQIHPNSYVTFYQKDEDAAKLLSLYGEEHVKILPQVRAAEIQLDAGGTMPQELTDGTFEPWAPESLISQGLADVGEILPLEAPPASVVHDLYEQEQWDIKLVTGNGASWSMPSGTGQPAQGAPVVVAVIDTGIDYNHPDLKANVLYGKTFAPDTTDYSDANGHGTHVAGAIAAKGRVMGVGPDLKLAAYRVFGATGKTTPAIIAEAIVAAADDQVDVINLSAGGYQWMHKPGTTTNGQMQNVKLLDKAVEYAIQKGVVVVQSAGNEGTELNNPSKLADKLLGEGTQGIVKGMPSVEQAIRVGAVDRYLRKAAYSNYGPGVIDVVAPGGDYSSKLCLSTAPGGGYRYSLGTSMAAPKVSALAGILIAQHGKGVLQPAQVKHLLEKTALDLGDPGTDSLTGHGLIQAVPALQ